jgi:hypothetical protein
LRFFCRWINQKNLLARFILGRISIHLVNIRLGNEFFRLSNVFLTGRRHIINGLQVKNVHYSPQYYNPFHFLEVP